MSRQTPNMPTVEREGVAVPEGQIAIVQQVPKRPFYYIINVTPDQARRLAAELLAAADAR